MYLLGTTSYFGFLNNYHYTRDKKEEIVLITLSLNYVKSDLWLSEKESVFPPKSYMNWIVKRLTQAQIMTFNVCTWTLLSIYCIAHMKVWVTVTVRLYTF